MSGDLGKTVGHAGIYTIGVLMNRLVSFLMLPVYTRYLSPADYGVLELLEVTVDVVSIVAGLGILNGLSKFYYQCRSEGERKELVSTLFLLIIGFYSVACAAGVLASPVLSRGILGMGIPPELVAVSFVNLFLQILFHLNTTYLRNRQKPVSFVVMNGLNLFLKLSLNVYFVIFLKMGVLGVLYSATISFALLGAGMTAVTFRDVRFRFSGVYAKSLIRFGYPFILSGLCAFVNTYADRYFLNHYTNLANVGIYSLAYKFGFLLMMFPVQPMMNIWMVQRFELVGKEGYEKTFNRFLEWFVIVTLTVALVIALGVRDVLNVMSAPAYREAYKLVPVLLLAYFFQACTDFFNFGIYQSGQTRHIAYGTLYAAVVTVAASFLLIPRFGAQGAAWATLVAFAVRMGYYYAASQKLFRIDYRLLKPVGAMLLAVATYLLYAFGNALFPVLARRFVSPAVSLLMLGIFGFLLLQLNIIEGAERKTLLSFLRFPVKTIRGLVA